MVTNRVKDAAGKPVSASPYFEALKSTTALTGLFAALEPIRANALVAGTTDIQLSGYAKVMDDLLTASATTTVSTRADIALLGRFITSSRRVPTDRAGAPVLRDGESAARPFEEGNVALVPVAAAAPHGGLQPTVAGEPVQPGHVALALVGPAALEGPAADDAANLAFRDLGQGAVGDKHSGIVPWPPDIAVEGVPVRVCVRFVVLGSIRATGCVRAVTGGVFVVPGRGPGR